MQKSKKIFVAGFATFFVASLCVAGLVSAQAGPFNNKGEVLGSKNITVFDLDENGAPIQGTGRQVIKYAYKSNVRIIDEPNEIISRRTKHSRTFSLGNQNGREMYKTEVISGAPQYYKDGIGRWWQAEYATSTPEEFAKRNESLSDKIFALLGVEKVWATTSTFYTEEDVESVSVDGSVRYDATGVTWNTAVTSSSGNYTYSSSEQSSVEAYSTGTTDRQQIQRGFFLFDTSSLPDTDTIDSGTITLWSSYSGTIRDDDANGYYVFVSSSPASNTNLTTGDYDQVGSVELSDTITTDAIDTGASNNYTTYGDNIWTLNSSGLANISKTGISKFAIREGHDLNNTKIDDTKNNYFQFCNADFSGSDKDPKLVIIHSAVPPVISNVQSSNVTISSAVVSWDTNITSDSKVVYGTTNPVENSSPLLDSYSSSLVTSHGASLTGLNSNTTYYYKTVSVKDGLAATSSQYSFTTLQNPVTYAYKPQDQSTTSQSVLFTDNDLSVTLDANSTYIITAAITASSTATQPDIKTSFSTPPGSSMALTFGSFDGSTKVAGSGLFAGDSDEVSIDLPSSGVVVIHIDGSVTTGSTAGTVDFEWAQNTSSADVIKLFKGSYLRAEKIE